MTAPHPLLGVPVTYEVAHGGWTHGHVTDVHGVNVTVCEYTGTCRYTYLLSDEGKLWRRAGVEYPEAAKEPETKTIRGSRFAYQAGDGSWWTGSGWSGSRKNKEPRALFPAALPDMANARMVRVPFRRRVSK